MKMKFLFFIAVCLFGAGSVSAAVVGEYLFDSNLDNSAGSGFAVSEIDSSGTYVTDSVWSESKKVLSLSGVQGLNINMSAWTGAADTYTIVMDVNLSQVSLYERIIGFDATGATSYPVTDTGFYVNGSNFMYYNYPDENIRPDVNNVYADTWTRLAVSRSGNALALYVGTPDGMMLTGSQSKPDNYPLIGSYLSFFRDNGSEHHDIKVSGIWLDSSALNAEQIAAIPEPASVPMIGFVIAAAFWIRRRFCE